MAGEDEIVALGEDQEDDAFSSLAGTIKAKFQTAENARQFDEKRWLRAYRNYRESMVMIWLLQNLKNLKYLLK